MPIILGIMFVKEFELMVSRKVGGDWEVKTTPHFCLAHQAAHEVLKGLSAQDGQSAKIVITVSEGTPPPVVFERNNVEGKEAINSLMQIALMAFKQLSRGPVVVLCADNGPPSSRMPTEPAPPDVTLN